MVPRTALALSILLNACNGAGPCLDACEEKRDFWEACMNQDGLLCDGSVGLACVGDMEAYIACEQTWFEGEGCDWDAMEADGVVFYCSGPGEAVRSCRAVAREHFRILDELQKESMVDACTIDSDPSDQERAMLERDCEAFCDTLLD
jgi:hypothetical protein